MDNGKGMSDIEQIVVILASIASREEVHRLAKFFRRWEFELSSTSPDMNRDNAWRIAQEPHKANNAVR